MTTKLWLQQGFKRFDILKADVLKLDQNEQVLTLLSLVEKLKPYVTDVADDDQQYVADYLKTAKVIIDNHTKWLSKKRGIATPLGHLLNKINSGASSLLAFCSEEGDDIIVEIHKQLATVALV